MQDRGIVKICQVGHILAFLVFRWVDLADQILLEVLGLYRSCVRQETPSTPKCGRPHGKSKPHGVDNIDKFDLFRWKYKRKEEHLLVPVVGHLRISVCSSIVGAGCAVRQLRLDRSNRPYLRLFRTLEDSLGIPTPS